MAGLAGFVDATASGDLFASSFEDGFHSVGVGEPVEVAGAAGYPVEQDEESVAALPTAVREFGGQHVEVVGVAAEVVSESEEQGAFERGEPFFDFEHRDREQHPDGVGGEFVVKRKFCQSGRLLPDRTLHQPWWWWGWSVSSSLRRVLASRSAPHSQHTVNFAALMSRPATGVRSPGRSLRPKLMRRMSV